MQYLSPSFFIIGERKCGTSALYRYLLDHPQVLPCKVKEPQFFSKPAWYRWLFFSKYRSLYPGEGQHTAAITWYELDARGKIAPVQLRFTADPQRAIITGEASANTFFQVPPQRLHSVYPHAKLILCVRHPVERAYSHYKMLRRFAKEGRRLPISFKDFASDFPADCERFRNGRPSYFAAQSLYATRLRAWSDVFGKDPISVVRSEDLSIPAKVNVVLDDLCTHLNIDRHDFGHLLSQKINVSPDGPDLPAEIRQSAFAFYADDIRQLESFTGRKFNWLP